MNMQLSEHAEDFHDAVRVQTPLEEDVVRLRDFDHRLKAFDKRWSAQRRHDDTPWAPAMGGDLHPPA
jgi:hypothetical protein